MAFPVFVSLVGYAAVTLKGAEISEKRDFGAKFSELIKLEKFFIVFKKLQ
jgi:hypothetical protein